jgi:hypothetical protein
MWDLLQGKTFVFFFFDAMFRSLALSMSVAVVWSNFSIWLIHKKNPFFLSELLF